MSAPSLDIAAARLRSDWLVDYLRDPTLATPRPWLEIPMPSFALDAVALDAVARAFAAHAAVPLVTAHAARGESLEADQTTARAVGRAVYEMLQCGRCHPGRGETGGLGRIDPAPDYRLAKHRLRPAWVERLLLDPVATLGAVEGRGMSRAFPLDAAGRPGSSFLVGALDAPMFDVQRARLQRLFADDDALRAYLADPERVARALRAHLWTLSDEP